MILLLNHSYKLTIGAASGSSQALVIDQHDIEFEVNKTVKDGVTLKIQISNLGPEETALVDSYGSQLAVFFSAGYETNSTLEIFKGISTQVFSTNDSGEDILHIFASTSEKLVEGSYSSISLPKGTTRRVALTALVKDLIKESKDNIDLQEISFQDSNLIGERMKETFDTGFSYTGSTEAGISKLLDPVEYTWFIDDGQFYAKPLKVGASLSVTVPLLSSDSGLYSIEKKLGKKDEAIRYILTCALLNNVKLGGSVKIEDDSLEGVFKIDKIKTAGSFTGNQWDTILEVSEKLQEVKKEVTGGTTI